MSFIKNHLGELRHAIHLMTGDRRSREWRAPSKNLHRFKDIHKGQSCFIIGNGPSLNAINLDSLIGIPTLASNKIYLIYDKTSWRPTYHFASDPYVIEQSLPNFLTLESTFFLSYLDTKNRIYRENFNYIWIGGEIFFNGKDLTNKVCGGSTVTYVALQTAFYMGFQEVYLVGMDHSYKQKGAPGEVEKMEGEDSNHFHPDYFKGQTWCSPILDIVEMCFTLAKHYYERDGRKIFNATVGGRLEIFERIDFDTALNRVKKANDIPLDAQHV